jgi:L-lysine exporter family protein LysE/ArgO
VLTLAGAAFLLIYGVLALRRARQTEGLHAATGSGPVVLHRAILEAAGFTLLNPHVYLDTVLLLGSIGASQTPAGQVPPGTAFTREDSLTINASVSIPFS